MQVQCIPDLGAIAAAWIRASSRAVSFNDAHEVDDLRVAVDFSGGKAFTCESMSATGWAFALFSFSTGEYRCDGILGGPCMLRLLVFRRASGILMQLSSPLLSLFTCGFFLLGMLSLLRLMLGLLFILL